ncbi:MAG: hypothetical protein RLZZ480_210 [Candidatus Parcubacteria bacterium]
MAWTRDFTCNNISCKNYKVKGDALLENNFCEPCAQQIKNQGLCNSCGILPANPDGNILFPWLCSPCEELMKESMFSAEKNMGEQRQPVQQTYFPVANQLPGPLQTMLCIGVLVWLFEAVASVGFLRILILTLLGLMLVWLPCAAILQR